MKFTSEIGRRYGLANKGKKRDPRKRKIKNIESILNREDIPTRQKIEDILFVAFEKLMQEQDSEKLVRNIQAIAPYILPQIKQIPGS